MILISGSSGTESIVMKVSCIRFEHENFFLQNEFNSILALDFAFCTLEIYFFVLQMYEHCTIMVVVPYIM